MMYGLLLICFITVLANGDVLNDIRVEEEKRHNQTLSKYVKAALGGAFHTIFPSVTDAETAEANHLFAHVFPIGDPLLLLPDNDEAIETNLCKSHRERGVKVLAYVRKRYPTHLIIQVTVRLGIHAIGHKNDEYCSTREWRNIYTSNATLINKHINELSAARNRLLDSNLVIVHGNNTLHKLAIVCCSIYAFKSDLVVSVPTQQSKHFVSDYIYGYNGPAINYLCVYHYEGSKACANLVIPPPPANVPRFTSVFQSYLAALSKITSISA